MLFIKDMDNFALPGSPRRTAVTIGNFDGCHLGHQALARMAVAHGQRLKALPLALTFTPRPEAFFRGQDQETLLFTEEQKTRALTELGLGCQLVQSFDAEFSRTPHAEFYERGLKQQLGAVAVVIGDNFRFGRGRAGDAAFLAAQSERDGLVVTVGEAAVHGGERISSTRIRETLTRRGEVDEAAAMLGRPYMLEGTIRRGDQLGRQLGVPTANLEETAQLLPRFGIYAGYVWLAPENDAAARPPVMTCPADAVPAVFSLGIRPTLGVTQPPVRIEAHLLSGQYALDSLYGRRAGYYLTSWIRPEEKFADLDALKRQIAADIAVARARLTPLPP